jgi:ATP-dependent DNA helicase RecG
MQQENEDMTIQIEKVLKLEGARGYNDDAVTCGLEAFIQRNLPAALSLVAGYAQSGPFDRQKAVSLLHDHLAEIDVGEEPVDDGNFPGVNPIEVNLAEVSLADLLLPVRYAKGVGEKRAARLHKLGIDTIEDLLTYLPRRIEDRSHFASIGTLRRGQEIAVRAEILAVDQIRTSARTTLVKAAVGDGTGFLYATWFNQPWLAKQLPRGETIDLFGKVEISHGKLQMTAPVWEPAGEKMEIGRLVPIYPATEGVSNRSLRALIARNFALYKGVLCDTLPDPVRERHHLLAKSDAVGTLHSPASPEAFEKARRSLAFEELFLLQLGIAQQGACGNPGTSHAGSGKIVDSFLAQLPFRLTASQQGAMREILADLRAPTRMMRLLQGDVGSGKTIVALVVALSAIEAGYQVVLMVPTEILAEQHSRRISELLAGLPIRVALLTGGKKDKKAVKEEVAAGRIDLLVGTHALIQEDVSFHALGLVIIDEQHRFGVVQRSLIEEKGEMVDLLVMSATPIPRTIALTLYGEFDVSLIDEMPLGKKDIQTICVSESRRPEVYTEVGRLLEAGEKGYVILPLVDESEKIDLKAAIQVAQELTAAFPSFGVGLIHGRLSPAEKSEVMEGFQDGRIHLLVATTVVEVGIDVLDASFMVIEHAERFGLSQLHQLRGRIGRSGQKATCFAIAQAKTDEAKSRLSAFAAHLDGFKIAEEDLLIRGPGDLLGTRQHGFLSQLHAVDLIRDIDIMGEARKEARALAGNPLPPALEDEIERRFGGPQVAARLIGISPDV